MNLRVTLLAGAALALATLSGATGAQAGVIQIGSQAAFTASGTIVQNTNWSSYGSGYTYPGNPFSVGDLTFVPGADNLIIGSGTPLGPVKNLLTDAFDNGTGVNIANTYELFGFNAGNFSGSSGAETFKVTTNLGSYTFIDIVNSATNMGPLSFYGFEASAGEHITSFNWFGGGFTGITDVQLGTVGAGVPEPATWAMMLLGFLGLGATLRAHRRADRELPAVDAATA